MKSLVLLGLIIGCVVVVTSGCNYNKEMCRAQYEEGKAKGDCYRDLSSAFGDKPIKACVDVCHPRTGDAVKCEDFCPDFISEGVCLAETSTVSTTTDTPSTSSTHLPPSSSTDLPSSSSTDLPSTSSTDLPPSSSTHLQSSSPKDQPTAQEDNISSCIPRWMIALCSVLATLVVLLSVEVAYLLCEKRNRYKELITWNNRATLVSSTSRQQSGNRATLAEEGPPRQQYKYLQSNQTLDSALPPSLTGTLRRSTAGWSSSGSQAETSLSAQSEPFLSQSILPETVQ